MQEYEYRHGVLVLAVWGSVLVAVDVDWDEVVLVEEVEV